MVELSHLDATQLTRSRAGPTIRVSSAAVQQSDLSKFHITKVVAVSASAGMGSRRKCDFGNIPLDTEREGLAI